MPLYIICNQAKCSMTHKPSYLTFKPSQYKWKKEINYRLHPEMYNVGKGEQGVLICQPYKDEIGPNWRFRTPELARQSSEKIYSMFLNYLQTDDFVGADMARKYLQMGFTRSRRYTNYKGGKKYGNDYQTLPRGTGDPQKAMSASIFYKKWQQAEAHPKYMLLKKSWKKAPG